VFTADDATLKATQAQGLLAMFSGPRTEELRGGFGPERAVAASAPLLERVLAIAARDINWRPLRRRCAGTSLRASMNPAHHPNCPATKRRLRDASLHLAGTGDHSCERVRSCHQAR
jgi:hypothetical protein